MRHDPQTLPPVGQITSDNAGVCVASISLLCEEAHTSGDYTEWVDQAERSANIRQYGQAHDPNRGDVVSNHILDDIAAMTDQQTKEPANKDYECCDTGQPSHFWLKDMPTDRPMTPQEVQEYQQLQQSGQMPPGELIEVNAKVVSKFYQKQCDYRWRMGRMDAKYRKIVLQANTLGFQFPIYEWRTDRKRPRLWTNISLRNIFVDPTADDIEEANYLIVDWIIDAREAEEMFPDFAEVIEDLSRRGTPQRIDGWTEIDGTVGKIGANVNINFQRNMVTLRVAWLRNQPCPLSLDEAIAGGHVEYRTVMAPLPGADYGTEDSSTTVPAEGMGEEARGTDTSAQSGSGMDSDAPQGTTPNVGNKDSDQALTGDQNETVQTGDSGGKGLPESSQNNGGETTIPAGQTSEIPQRQPAQGLFHAATNQQITPPTTNESGTMATHDLWPMKLVTRQTVVIMSEPEESEERFYRSRIVEDVECRYRTINGSDIPAAFLAGIPVLFKLVGMGLPQKLESLQAARNRMLTAVVQHTDHHRFPIWTMPESVWQVIPDKFKKYGQSLAGAWIRLRDELYTRLQGKILTSVAPEPVSETTFQAIELMQQDLDQRASHAQVTEGTPPPGVIGHQSIEALQQAGQTKLNSSSQDHRDAQTRIAELHLYACIDNLELDDLKETDQSMPDHVINDIRQWALNACWEVDVADSTGLGPMKSQQQSDAYRKFSTVNPTTGETAISFETLLERIGEDYETEHSRNMTEQGQALQMKMQAQAAMAPQQQQQQPANGRMNGNH